MLLRHVWFSSKKNASEQAPNLQDQLARVERTQREVLDRCDTVEKQLRNLKLDQEQLWDKVTRAVARINARARRDGTEVEIAAEPPVTGSPQLTLSEAQALARKRRMGA